jgi:uncharacterized protein (DUF885 family)
MFSRSISYLILLGLTFSNATLLCAADNPSLDARRAQFDQLLKDEWEYQLKENPELATVFGDYRCNDRWSDGSLAHVQQQKRDAQQWLSKFAAVDTTGFPEQERLNQSLMMRWLKQELQGMELKTYEMPLDQFNGEHPRITWLACITFQCFLTT